MSSNPPDINKNPAIPANNPLNPSNANANVAAPTPEPEPNLAPQPDTPTPTAANPAPPPQPKPSASPQEEQEQKNKQKAMDEYIEQLSEMVKSINQSFTNLIKQLGTMGFNAIQSRFGGSDNTNQASPADQNTPPQENPQINGNPSNEGNNPVNPVGDAAIPANAPAAASQSPASANTESAPPASGNSDINQAPPPADPIENVAGPADPSAEFSQSPESGANAMDASPPVDNPTTPSPASDNNESIKAVTPTDPAGNAPSPAEPAAMDSSQPPADINNTSPAGPANPIDDYSNVNAQAIDTASKSSTNDSPASDNPGPKSMADAGGPSASMVSQLSPFPNLPVSPSDNLAQSNTSSYDATTQKQNNPPAPAPNEPANNVQPGGEFTPM